jgi:hypothetical protein
MKTTIEFLDAVKAKHSLTSDYQLSKLLVTTTSRVGNYRSGRSTLDGDMCLKVADALKLDPAYVLNCVAAERSKSEKVKRAYMHAAKIIAPAALALLVVFGTLPAYQQLGPVATDFIVPTVPHCILC